MEKFDIIAKIVEITLGLVSIREILLISKKTKLEINDLKKKQDKDGS